MAPSNDTGVSEKEHSSTVPIQTEKNGENTRFEPFWIFGYGSLCWNPGFEYQQSLTGYVRGFSRRFWQGNTTHRGTDSKIGDCGCMTVTDVDYHEAPDDSVVNKRFIPDSGIKPGRVATLIEDTEGITWGKAFLVAAEDNTALPYLSNRECQLGGYKTCTVLFHPRPSLFFPSSSSNQNNVDKKNALLYIAVPENRHWLGAAPLPDIAKQILECHGNSGSNVEYLLRLADFMREEIPEALDEHLFSLERLVKKFAADMKVCLRVLMGESSQTQEREESKTEAKAVVPSNQFASRIPEKKLRCVNM